VLAEFDLAIEFGKSTSRPRSWLGRWPAVFTSDKPNLGGSMTDTKLRVGTSGFFGSAMAAAYEEQAAALIEGGVDVLLIETCQDLLQAKSRPSRAGSDAETGNGCRSPYRYIAGNRDDGSSARDQPALTSLEPFDVDISAFIADGTKEMNDAVRYLA